jgi:hypothetical protein
VAWPKATAGNLLRAIDFTLDLFHLSISEGAEIKQLLFAKGLQAYMSVWFISTTVVVLSFKVNLSVSNQKNRALRLGISGGALQG